MYIILSQSLAFMCPLHCHFVERRASNLHSPACEHADVFLAVLGTHVLSTPCLY